MSETTTSAGQDSRTSRAPAPVRARRRAVALAEAIEDERQDLRPDSLTGVAHHDLDVGGGLSQEDPDAASARRELDRVHQEVPDNLLQTVGCAPHGAGVGIE